MLHEQNVSMIDMSQIFKSLLEDWWTTVFCTPVWAS